MINSFLKANGRRSLMFFYQEVEQDGSGRQKLFIAFIGKIVRKKKTINTFWCFERKYERWPA